MDDDKTTLSEKDKAIIHAISELASESRATAKYIDKLTEFVMHLDARTSGTEVVASVVDENQTEVETLRHIDTQKELISHLYEKSHQYVTIIIAGAFAAYFATFSTVAQRYTTTELLLSAGLMSFSLMVFVLWEIFQICYISYSVINGSFGTKKAPSWHNPVWGVALLLTIGTGIPAMILALWTYLDGLGIF